MDKQKVFWLNSNGEQTSYLALGSQRELVLQHELGAWSKITDFLNNNLGEFIFGWLGYDLKNDIENLSSNNQSWVKIPMVYLMVPDHLAKIEQGQLKLIKGNLQALLNCFENLSKSDNLEEGNDVQVKSSIDHSDYIDRITSIQEHIRLGDIYEANFCYEYTGEGTLKPLKVYHRLNEKTKAPFSVYAQVDDIFVLSASPERFVRREGNTIVTQPIKGTIKRGITPEEDDQLKMYLQSNPKDRSENIMIVDLVRNDLSKIAAPKSVKVDELCKIYTFENIHQMISTVSAEVKDKHPVEIIRAMFPMGSMTGAPKIRAMELIENYEISKRGLYSGAIGYFAPNGDFDFNVVIRTILYNETTRKFSFSVGGAITDLSSPEAEYEETLLKARAMKEALSE